MQLNYAMQAMIPILDGNSKTGAQVRANFCHTLSFYLHVYGVYKYILLKIIFLTQYHASWCLISTAFIDFSGQCKGKKLVVDNRFMLRYF